MVSVSCMGTVNYIYEEYIFHSKWHSPSRMSSTFLVTPEWESTSHKIWPTVLKEFYDQPHHRPYSV